MFYAGLQFWRVCTISKRCFTLIYNVLLPAMLCGCNLQIATPHCVQLVLNIINHNRSENYSQLLHKWWCSNWNGLLHPQITPSCTKEAYKMVAYVCNFGRLVYRTINECGCWANGSNWICCLFLYRKTLQRLGWK